MPDCIHKMDIAIGTPLIGLAAFTNSMGVRERETDFS